MTKVPGTADKYSVITGTTITPPAVPGKTVKYSVRANSTSSAWAAEVSIAYPAGTTTTPTTPPTTTTPTTPPPTTTPTVDTKAAPAVSISGNTVKWDKVGNVDTYVFVRKVPGATDEYTAVSGTSTTPAAVAGKTVKYSVRTAVEGSAWSPEVSITYPATSTGGGTTTPTEPTTPTNPTPPTSNGSFSMGLVAGSALTYEYDFIKALGAKTARLEFTINTSTANMRSTIDLYARNGIRPLLLASFYGRIPTSAEAQNLGTWAKEFGPNGTFWAGKNYPTSVRPTEIEFGNETSYSYQFSDTYGKSGFGSISTYQQRAKDYAVRAKEAAQAIKAAGTGVGLVAIGEPSGAGSSWVNNMFAAVPDLGSYVSGWTIHPYGPDWKTRIDQTIQYTEAKGAPSNLPLYVTEWGLATDNGRCLDDNYGWDKCMSYSSAASTLTSTVNDMKSRYGSRLRGFYLYQAHDQKASGASAGREYYFGALKDDKTSKGSYTDTVKSLLAAN